MEKHMNKVQQKNKCSLFTHAHTSDSQSLVGGVSTGSVQSEVAAQLTVWGCLCGCFINAFCACVSQVWQAEEYGCLLVLTGVCVSVCLDWTRLWTNRAASDTDAREEERERCPAAVVLKPSRLSGEIYWNTYSAFIKQTYIQHWLNTVEYDAGTHMIQSVCVLRRFWRTWYILMKITHGIVLEKVQ